MTPAGRGCASLRITQRNSTSTTARPVHPAADAPHSNAGFIPRRWPSFFHSPGVNSLPRGITHRVGFEHRKAAPHFVAGRSENKRPPWDAPAKDSNDAAFRTLRAGDAPQTLNLCQDVVAVHGVLDASARDEYIAVELRHR